MCKFQFPCLDSKKWVKVREAIQKTHGINVNFSIKSAYKYVTKSDGGGGRGGSIYNHDKNFKACVAWRGFVNLFFKLLSFDMLEYRKMKNFQVFHYTPSKLTTILHGKMMLHLCSNITFI